MPQLAATPAPPYYAVIFSSIRSDQDADGYARMADAMLDLAERQPGFLGVESARETVGITVSYRRDEESILNWKRHVHHPAAQRLGRRRWYKDYRVRVARVEPVYALGGRAHAAA
ncbi:antibiotic biosynthesis monooxygenase [uncultured Thiohalocapsa sp.]|uniref:antibiotic biosynthesis monooxygenase family protein n=1 Tax=uncultured Thiohalocapsa sp. TaxID=768990 RepID=UPI0025DA3698|nr:antibiotic biosynthesis monooxygenase [uncultured Thiohalocapsa sp.]